MEWIVRLGSVSIDVTKINRFDYVRNASGKVIGVKVFGNDFFSAIPPRCIYNGDYLYIPVGMGAAQLIEGKYLEYLDYCEERSEWEDCPVN